MEHADDSMAAIYRHGIEDSRLISLADHVQTWAFPATPEPVVSGGSIRHPPNEISLEDSPKAFPWSLTALLIRRFGPVSSRPESDYESASKAARVQIAALLLMIAMLAMILALPKLIPFFVDMLY